MPTSVSRDPSWLQWIVWALCGGAAAVVLVGAFALAPLGLIAAGGFASVALVLGGANISAIGAAAGVGSWGFVLGWQNRHGPGDYCWGSASKGGCNQEWSPWPFVIIGAVLVIASLAVFWCLKLRLRMTARI